MKTIRQEIAERIEGEPMGVRELSQDLQIQEKEIYLHLEHIAKTARAAGKKLSVIPASCLDCGFLFRDRKKLTPPGHCPKCKGTHIQRPLYEIK